MRIFAAGIFGVLTATAGMAQGIDAHRLATAKQGIQELVRDLNAAGSRRDCAALELLFAEEFVFVHATGYVDDRPTHIEDVLSTEPFSPVPIPTFDPPREFILYGHVAVLRGASPGRFSPGLFGTSIYAKKDGRWQFVQIQGTALQAERPTIQVDRAVLDLYVGTYAREGGVQTVIQREGDALVAQVAGIPRRILKAASEDRFFDKLGSEYAFQREGALAATGFVLKLPDGRQVNLVRIE